VKRDITRPRLEGLCNWCRDEYGDIYCDKWPICFECLEILLERERALKILDDEGLGKYMRNSEYFDSWTPWGWERD
jgi:hypothetical protein